MTRFGEIEARRKRNAAVFNALRVRTSTKGTVLKTVREGTAVTIFTIGYEKRSLEELISSLVDAGIKKLIDVREKPMSRKPDFRKSILAAACDDAGITYESWTRLGSTASQREFLKETRDIPKFMRRFRDFARKGRGREIDALVHEVRDHEVALLCYERAHNECHRSVVADLVADATGASVVAIQ